MPEINGRAYIAPWIVKMLAVAMLTASIAWAGIINRETITHKVRIDNLEKQSDRIEGKLDRIIYNLEDNRATPTR